MGEAQIFYNTSCFMIIFNVVFAKLMTHYVCCDLYLRAIFFTSIKFPHFLSSNTHVNSLSCRKIDEQKL